MLTMLSAALTLLYVLTAQVSAQAPTPVQDVFNVTLGKQQVFLYNQLLDFSFNGPISRCTNNCTSAKSALAVTNGDPNQLCQDNAPAQLLLKDCEQCMFTALIEANKPMPDPRAGSTPVLTGYAAQCSIRVKKILPKNFSLVVPPTWDGPKGIVVPTIGLVFTVGTGAFFATSALILLSNM